MAQAIELPDYLARTDERDLDQYCQHCGAWITNPQKHREQNQHHHLIAGTEPPDWYRQSGEEINEEFYK